MEAEWSGCRRLSPAAQQVKSTVCGISAKVFAGRGRRRAVFSKYEKFSVT
jgi:hypothetical protein